MKFYLDLHLEVATDCCHFEFEKSFFWRRFLKSTTTTTNPTERLCRTTTTICDETSRNPGFCFCAGHPVINYKNIETLSQNKTYQKSIANTRTFCQDFSTERIKRNQGTKCVIVVLTSADKRERGTTHTILHMGMSLICEWYK